MVVMVNVLFQSTGIVEIYQDLIIIHRSTRARRIWAVDEDFDTFIKWFCVCGRNMWQPVAVRGCDGQDYDDVDVDFSWYIRQTGMSRFRGVDAACTSDQRRRW